MSVIDAEGFRANVGMIVSNDHGQVIWAKRHFPAHAWQFPQGGMDRDESPEQAMYRELFEELGLQAEDVEVLGVTAYWLRYDLPSSAIRHHQKPVCIGQKQRWFLLRLLCEDQHICLTRHDAQEFAQWRWVDYDYPIDHIVPFKRDVYRQALHDLRPFLRLRP